MNRFFSALALTVILSSPAFATSVLPREVSPSLVRVRALRVENSGYVLKRDKASPIERIIVGIPVLVKLPNACTKFVGQQLVATRRAPLRIVAPATSLELLGAQSALNDACIAVAVAPLQTVLTLEFQANVASSNPFVAKLIGISGTSYEITLNTHTEQVTISPVLTAVGH